MNLLFKCFKCEIEKKEKGEIEKIIHSYSWNKDDPYEPFKHKLCKHFSSIKFNWKTRYGFFTLGWKVEIMNVNVECANCKKNIDFGNQTFSSNYHDFEEYKECCDNIINYSAHEGITSYDNEGLELQKKIEEQKKSMKEAAEKLKKLKEEVEKLEIEERQRQEREEKKRREIENKLRKQKEKENKELDEIINMQEKENEELNNQIDTDISYIDIQMIQMTNTSDINYSIEINFNAKKEINKNINYQMVKT